mgnify:CR=1 FL=1
MSLAIGVDLGGTKIAAGVVDEAGQILDERRQPTPTSSAEAVVDAMVSMIRELQAAHPVTAVGIGAPCFIAHDRDYVMFTANLPIRDIRLGSAVAEKTNLPTIVENDANAAAWAEFQFGAARGATGDRDSARPRAALDGATRLQREGIFTEAIGGRVPAIYDPATTIGSTRTAVMRSESVPGADTRSQVARHICFSVPNLDVAVAWFDQNNVTYVKRPDQGKMKDVIFVKDADGYWIEVIQADRMAALGG